MNDSFANTQCCTSKLSLRIQGPAFLAAMFMVVVAIPLFLTYSTGQVFYKFSPIDEGPHYDYAQRIFTHGPPVFGDTMLPSSLNDLSCRGIALNGIVLPPCGTLPIVAANYPGQGLQYESQQPPLYYAVSKIGALVGHLVGFTDFKSMRMLSGLMLVAGLLTTLVAGLLLGVARWLLLAALFAVGTAPSVIYQQTIVSNDAAGILCGAAVMYLCARVIRGIRVNTSWAVGLGIAAGFTKATFAIPCVVGAVVLVVIAVREKRVSRWCEAVKLQQVKVAIGLMAGSALAVIAWTIRVKATSYISLSTIPAFDVLRQHPGTIKTIFRESFKAYWPLTDSYTPFNGVDGDLMRALANIACFAGIGAMASGAFVSVRTWWSTAGPIALVLQYCGFVLLSIGTWKTYKIDPGMESRYALSMIPLVVLVLCAGVQRRSGAVIYIAGALLMGLVFAWHILHSSAPT